eukprot:CAMPEP_0197836510 /NCGR_PEP_ID=MMETSP1437-20131217/29252_1 /TAXON_ID=49252 ORGANISM="Eucampia antarctica, Strain CCMP1452" /NCGR_SAMPLE_ID=MMETSP1437 /ASSEMBLY_ACC=CAM_ASM_001096 /LENGTH=115 /DNA_ID=CAMNT_0043442757 /DNA_START=191 /DNA_END=535 /DNA_ORIENTATION=+
MNRPSNAKISPKPPSGFLFIKAGLPLVLFSIGASLVVKNAVEGQNREREASKGLVSKSERQARMEREHDDMVHKINKQIVPKEFDNTKRIERPEEILERRKHEREQRNKWYRRAW